ncbi:MAG: glycosyltransferase family 4 protein [Candidatus Omnitrophota bacterium]|jgi:glycosyltransferase involved in cell wall biosynthesis
MVSRSVEPPWDEASRNLVRDIVLRVEGKNFHILTSGAGIAEEKDVFSRKVYSSRRHDLLQKTRLLLFLIKNRAEFDLYHFCFTPEPVTSFLIKRIVGGKKKVQSIPYLTPRAKGKAVKDLIYSEAVTVTSRRTRDILEKSGIKGVRVVYPGIDTDLFSPKGDREQARKIFLMPEGFNVLWAGDLASEKVVHAMFDIIRKTCLDEKDINFVIAARIKGREDMGRKSALRKKLAGTGLKDRVVFLDTIERMDQLMAASDLFIYPFFDGFRRKIDIPYVIVEAMASGLPVVISDKEPINEVIVEGAGLAVKEESAEAFSDRIKFLFKNADLRGELGRKNRKAALRHFNVNENVKEFGEIYESLLR